MALRASAAAWDRSLVTPASKPFTPPASSRNHQVSLAKHDVIAGDRRMGSTLRPEPESVEGSGNATQVDEFSHGYSNAAERRGPGSAACPTCYERRTPKELSRMSASFDRFLNARHRQSRKTSLGRAFTVTRQ